MSLQSVIQLLGGVGLFLFAIKLISEALQLIAGDRLRQFIGTLTRTPVMGVLVGTCVTVLIQSSSATTVMTVSFVDAGLLTLTQAIGVIMGANIGTTVTGQILAINVKNFAYLFIILGVLLAFFGRSKVAKYAGNGILGFGLLFVGMQTMESAMSFLRYEQELFVTFSRNPFMGVLAGTLLTLLVQSSAATVGLTIALGTQGLLTLPAAIPIILGDNIGTTITAILASIGTNRTAKQACAAHVLFNIIGVCIFLPLLPLYEPWIAATASSIGHQIANAHSLFNICNTVLFLPFVRPFAAFIRKILPDTKHKSMEGAQYLDPKLIEATPVMAVEAVKNECAYMGFLVIHLLDMVHDVFFDDKKEMVPEIEATEEKVDHLYRAVRSYGADILQAGISENASRALALYVSSAGDIERIGDHGKKLLEYYNYRRQKDNDFSSQALTELQEMFTEAHHAIVAALDGFINDDPEKAKEVAPLAQKLRRMEVELRNRHIQRLDQQECDSETGLIFVDVLGLIEHIGYHSNNLAKATIATCKAVDNA